MKYKVRVEQTHYADIEIEADSVQDADVKLHEMNGNNAFEFSDIDTRWTVINPNKEEDIESKFSRSVEIDGKTLWYTIDIWYSDENGGYMYDLYEGYDAEVDLDEEIFDGGCCTGSYKEALEMADGQARDYYLTKTKNQNE